MRLAPSFIGIAVFIEILSFLFKTPLGKSSDINTPMTLLLATAVAALAGQFGRVLDARITDPDTADSAEAIFRNFQIGTSSYVALAQRGQRCRPCDRSLGRDQEYCSNRAGRY